MKYKLQKMNFLFNMSIEKVLQKIYKFHLKLLKIVLDCQLIISKIIIVLIKK